MRKYVAYNKMDVDTQVAVMMDIGEYFVNNDDDEKVYWYGWTEYGFERNIVDALIDLYFEILKSSTKKDD